MRVFLFFHQSRHVAMEFRGDSRKYGDSNEFVLEKEDIASHFSEKDFSFYRVCRCNFAQISPIFPARFARFQFIKRMLAVIYFLVGSLQSLPVSVTPFEIILFLFSSFFFFFCPNYARYILAYASFEP